MILQKLEELAALVEVPNVDKDPEGSIRGMKMLNKIAELRGLINKTEDIHSVMPRLFSVSLVFQNQIKDRINIVLIDNIIEASNEDEALGIVINGDNEVTKTHKLHLKSVRELNLNHFLIKDGA